VNAVHPTSRWGAKKRLLNTVAVANVRGIGPLGKGPGRSPRGFTLTEVSIAMAVIGFGILSLLHAMGAGTNVNTAGRELTQAVFLAQEIREWTVQLPLRDPQPADADNPPGPDGTSPQTFVDDLDDLMNVTYSPPRDAAGAVITGMQGWSQTISLQWRDPDSLLTAVTPRSIDNEVICVSVTVRCRGEDVLTSSWLVFEKEAP